MKTTRTVFAGLLFLAGILAAQTVFAGGPHRGHYRGHGGGHWHSSVGFYFGAPFLGYPYYYPRYYAPYYYPAYSYYPAPVVVQQQATEYVEQNPQPAPSAQQSATAGYWYFCAASNAYYPYVKDCAAGWQRVSPIPGK